MLKEYTELDRGSKLFKKCKFTCVRSISFASRGMKAYSTDKILKIG